MTKEAYEAKRKQLLAEAKQAIEANKLTDFEAKKAEIEQLDKDFEASARAMANLNALTGAQVGGQQFAAKMANAEEKFAPAQLAQPVDMHDSPEYHAAFMNYVTKQAPIPEKFRNSNEQTTTGDVGAVIPTTIIQKIYEKMENVGKIWNRVTKTAFKGGAQVPTSTAVPVATWVSERGTSDTQKKAIGSVTFSYYKLTCKVSLSFETTEVTLGIFETSVINGVSKAMVKACECAVFSGTGSGQPKGILTETVAAGQNIDIAKSASITFKDIAKMEGALPEEYEDGAIWVMTKKTRLNEFVGMVDANGQPVLRETLGENGKPKRYILGREVIDVSSDCLPVYAASVNEDKVFALIFDFSYYLANVNYEITMREYIDEDTDDRVKKALMLVDGKAVDVNSLVTMTKKAN